MKSALLIVLFGLDAAQRTSVDEVAASGRCVNLGDAPDARVSYSTPIAPGAPPLLSFRAYEGKLHQRFGNSDLMLDDAGH